MQVLVQSFFHVNDCCLVRSFFSLALHDEATDSGFEFDRSLLLVHFGFSACDLGSGWWSFGSLLRLLGTGVDLLLSMLSMLLVGSGGKLRVELLVLINWA